MNVNERAAQMLHQYAEYLRDERPPSGHEDADAAEIRDAEARALADGLTHGIHLITAAPVLPDNDGFWAHPGIPDHFDEDPAPFERWLNEQLLECAPKEVGDKNAQVAADWADSKPSGSGWFLLQLIDTEDGPTAFWVRRVMENPNAHKVSVLRGELVRERDYRLRAEAQVDFLKHRLGDEHASVWYWQGDGYDNLDSLVSSVTVAIRADDLRHLLGAPQVAVPDLPDEVTADGYGWLQIAAGEVPVDDAPTVLRAIAKHIVAAPTAPVGEPEFYVEHKTLRSAMAYVGIAAPESDEELGAEMERHAKRVIRAAAKLLAQQPVSDPDGLGRVLMPRALTAENGAKTALSGEFFVTNGVQCAACGNPDFSLDLGECAGCQHSESEPNLLVVPWTTIKRIYTAAVDLLSAPAPDEREIAGAIKALEVVGMRISSEVVNFQGATANETGARAAHRVVLNEIARLRAGKEGA